MASNSRLAIIWYENLRNIFLGLGALEIYHTTPNQVWNLILVFIHLRQGNSHNHLANWVTENFKLAITSSYQGGHFGDWDIFFKVDHCHVIDDVCWCRSKKINFQISCFWIYQMKEHKKWSKKLSNTTRIWLTDQKLLTCKTGAPPQWLTFVRVHLKQDGFQRPHGYLLTVFTA